MRLLALVITLICPLQAELIARFHTSQGVVDVALQYEKVPQAVANFVTLAEGTRTYLDAKSGAILRGPYYDGTKIHRIGDNSSFKFAQGGSRVGDGSDGPGYNFKDAFDPTLTHVPYVLSMANSGPNSNGGGFFFTGNVAIPGYDGSYTLFGMITDPASRLVIDAMIAAGPNGTTINQVTILRTDPNAVAFDEHSHNLPVVTMPGGSLSVFTGVSASWQLSPFMIAGDVFRAFRSTTLGSSGWAELNGAETHLGISPPLLTPFVTSVNLDAAALPKAFYNLSLVHHPGSVTPSTLAGRTVTTAIRGDLLAYAFDNSGNSGIATYINTLGATSVFPFEKISFSSDGHSMVLIVENFSATFVQYLQLRIGCDTASDTLITGRHFTYRFNANWVGIGGGVATITR